MGRAGCLPRSIKWRRDADMEPEQKEQLCEQLDTIDTSLVFLVLLILSVVLSWKATAIQREGLCRILLGQSTQVPDVYPLRLSASAIVVGALVFFFLLSLNTQEQAQGQDPLARCSAGRNVLASFLVLAAALIRLLDLNEVHNRQPALSEEALPIE